MKLGDVEECGLCSSDELNLILDMGEQPLAERLGDDRIWPLGLLRCRSCGLVQLSYIVDRALVFPLNHPYASGNTRALREHFSQLASVVEPFCCPGDLVVDIGANDGTFLKSLSPALRKLGVEPTNQVRKILDAGIPATQAFFSSELGRVIYGDHGPARVITASNVLAHIPDPHDFIEGVQELLDDDSTFIAEVGCLDGITDGLQIDSIYHEHLRYYSVASFSRLLDMHGMQVTSAQKLPLHGGIYRFTASRRQGELEVRAHRTASSLRSLLRFIDENGGQIYGIGAATRATTLIHYARIARYITCVCEVEGSEKIGHTMPGTGIPIVLEDKLIADQPTHALLFAWQIADDLMPKLRAAGFKGKFVIPLPTPRIA